MTRYEALCPFIARSLPLTSSRGVSPLRHREERSDDAIHLPELRPPQLLRLGIPGLPRTNALAKTEKETTYCERLGDKKK